MKRHFFTLPTALLLLCTIFATGIVLPVLPINGGASRVVYADEDTGVEGFINRLYDLTLGRRPDQIGFNDWVNKLKSGETNGGDCAYGFFFSDEFLAKNLPDEEYVEILYHVFFDRNSDSAGKADWVNRLSSGTSRLSVFYGFVNSNEWAELCVRFGIASGGTGSAAGAANVEGITTFVCSLYSDCLGREPDPVGLSSWVDKLSSGQITGKEAAYGFFFSNEFLSKDVRVWDNESLGEYIGIYYKVFLDREADQGGLDYWLSRTLNNQFANLILFEGFSDSNEFARKCNSNGIVPGSHVNLDVGSSDFARWAMSFATGGRQWNNMLEFLAAPTGDMAPHFPYVFAGLSPQRGIDCSGMIVHCIQTYHGVNNVPHHMLTMARSYGITINPADIRPGDLVCDGVGPHGWVYLYVGRVGPDVRGGYHDYILYGHAGDFDESSEYGYNSWLPGITELSYSSEDGWGSECATVPEWIAHNPGEYRIARVPR